MVPEQPRENPLEALIRPSIHRISPSLAGGQPPSKYLIAAAILAESLCVIRKILRDALHIIRLGPKAEKFGYAHGDRMDHMASALVRHVEQLGFLNDHLPNYLDDGYMALLAHLPNKPIRILGNYCHSATEATLALNKQILEWFKSISIADVVDRVDQLRRQHGRSWQAWLERILADRWPTKLKMRIVEEYRKATLLKPGAPRKHGRRSGLFGKKKITDKQTEAIRMREITLLTFTEIGQALNITRQSARGLYRRGKDAH